MKKLHLYEFELPLRHVFTISRGSVAVQKTLIVDLEEDGLHGYGEATTNPYYGATIENMAAALIGCGRKSNVGRRAIRQNFGTRFIRRCEPTLLPTALWIKRPTICGQESRLARVSPVGPEPRRAAGEQLHNRHRLDRDDGRQAAGVSRLAGVQD